MKRLALVLPLLPLGVASTTAATPRIIGDSQDPRCREALHLAEVAFRATSGTLLWPIPTPRPPARIILRQNARDISGGEAIDADSGEFTKVRAKDHEPIFFWSKRVSRGRRLVVVDEPFNWRGDWYYVYLARSDVTAEQLAEDRNSKYSALKPLLGDNRWSPPLVLQDASSRRYWLIDRGEPYKVMADWKVYLPAGSRLSTPCQISFGYSTHGGVNGRLPAVRRLAADLDEVLGPGTGEGTLQQTAAIRDEVAREWANATLRPWALTDQPYNSRAEVEKGLRKWARASGRRTTLLRRIWASYPEAQRELASFYAAQFGSRPSAAQRLSKRALDHLFRTYFVFAKRVQ